MSRCLLLAAAVALAGLDAARAAPSEEVPLQPPATDARPTEHPAEGPIEVIVVRSQIDGREREQPIISGSGTTFTECAASEVCPQMLVVPSSEPGLVLGEVTQTDPAKRLHGITIKGFAIGKYEVSVAEYDRCVAASACRPPEWREPASQFNSETGSNYKDLGPTLYGENYPIVGVSYTDAAAYAAWLSKLTGRDYRLPSETEWEYAARAGSHSQYWWGDDPRLGGVPMAVCRGCGSDWDAKANAPVASFAANTWGLHNVHGNVWEWVGGYYCDDFSTNPIDGTPRNEDNCPHKDAPDLRVLRGGSSFYGPSFMRSAARLTKPSGFRSFSVGFRIARTLLP